MALYGGREKPNQETRRLREMLPGAGIALSIAMISFMASLIHPAFDPLAISLIFGLLVANLLGEREMFEIGTNAVLRVFLPLGIGLYGIQLEFSAVEVRYLPPVAAVFVFLAVVTYFVAKGFGLGRSIAVLIGAGMSVCGASAIAVIAPLMEAKKEDTSIAIISVMTIGLTGVLVYSFIPSLLGMGLEKFAFLSGATLPMLGQVKVASRTLGEDCLRLAVNFKLMRVSALAFVALAAVWFSGGEKKKIRALWFMVLFFALALAANLSREAASLRGVLGPLGTFSLTAALSAIGMSLEFDSITARGVSPLFAAFIAWGIVVLSIYLALSLTG
jgi:uncharacterized integral membrane protein (TIGR00698 family)